PPHHPNAAIARKRAPTTPRSPSLPHLLQQVHVLPRHIPPRHPPARIQRPHIPPIPPRIRRRVIIHQQQQIPTRKRHLRLRVDAVLAHLLLLLLLRVTARCLRPRRQRPVPIQKSVRARMRHRPHREPLRARLRDPLRLLRRDVVQLLRRLRARQPAHPAQGPQRRRPRHTLRRRHRPRNPSGRGTVLRPRTHQPKPQHTQHANQTPHPPRPTTPGRLPTPRTRGPQPQRRDAAHDAVTPTAPPYPPTAAKR
ncbi:MAG: hypothetical protein ACK559_18970, partial [bacterium]